MLRGDMRWFAIECGALVSVDNTMISLHWILIPKSVTRILFDLQTEHIFDKACYEDDKYPISFFLNWIFHIWRKGGIHVKFDLKYLLKCPSWGFWGPNFLSDKNLNHTCSMMIYKWSKVDEKCRRSSILS